MHTINERDFRMACDTGTVLSVSIIEVEGGFLVQLELSWKEGKHTLFTERKRPHVWANVNTIIDYLKRQGFKLDVVTLLLRRAERTQ